MDVFFCHGLESAPHGRKYQALTGAGLDVTAPDFRNLALADRVARLVPLLRGADRPVVVGSSYGGITALCAAVEVTGAGAEVTGLVLCAPALGRREPPATNMALVAPVPTVIVHGTRDDVVPISVSRAFAAANPGRVTLIEVDDEHRLAGSLDRIVAETRALLGVAPS